MQETKRWEEPRRLGQREKKKNRFPAKSAAVRKAAAS